MESERTPALPPAAPSRPPDGAVERLVGELIDCIADRWTMLVLEALDGGGVLRFGERARAVPGISQKMLTRTVRRLKELGLVRRTVYPTIPPRVEYRLTALAATLHDAFRGVWTWADDDLAAVQAARRAFAARYG